MSSKTQHKQPEHPTTSNYAFVHTHIENQRIDFWIPKGRHGFATNRAPQNAHNHESMLANSRTTSMSIHAQEKPRTSIPHCQKKQNCAMSGAVAVNTRKSDHISARTQDGCLRIIQARSPS